MRDDATLERIRALAIPPAWTDVWICMDPDGHLQAVGCDVAGRRQYLYHPRWRARRDVEKFEHVEAFAAALPTLRARVQADITARGLPRERVLALAVRLLDSATFRIGSDAYARENGSFGLATLRRQHVELHRNRATFRYRAKSGVTRIHEVRDADAIRVIRALLRRPGRGGRLLVWIGPDDQVVSIRAADVNAYIREGLGVEGSAKDFRTWHATVLAALGFAGQELQPQLGQRQQDRVVRSVVATVAESMGNTPAVCRASYIDPRIIDRYREGITVADHLPPGTDPWSAAWDLTGRASVERAVLALLAGSDQVQRAA